MRALLIASVTLGIAGHAAAQQPRFDVASVKQCKPDDEPGHRIISGEHLLLTCIPLINAISMAYGESGAIHFPVAAIEGAPSWSRDRYTIDARTGRDVGEDTVRGPMLRALLEERFHLRVRQETRQSPAFALTVDKHGSKLKPFDGTCTPWDTPHPDAPTPQKPLCKVNRAGRGWVRDVDYHGFTLATVVQQLNGDTGDLGAPIIDRTGIEGLFDVHLKYLGGDGMDASADVTLPRLPEALREQLGLTLEKITTPQDFLVIEHIERPSGN